jgi:N-glycosylase/DNA lyase
MKIRKGNDYIDLIGLNDFSLKDTFECGQCFRWKLISENKYIGIAYGKPLIIEQKEDCIRLYINGNEFREFWKDYFDLDRDYNKIRKIIQYDEFLRKASKYGRGIKILKQEPWETFCSFIISQQNNIPRIKNIVERISEKYGNVINKYGMEFYDFPSPEKFIEIGISGLKEFSLGYRDVYLIDAAYTVFNKEIDLESLKYVSSEQSLKELIKFKGVGSKVANCVNLFSLQHIDSFPIDVWIQRVIDVYYNGHIDIIPYKEVAGIVQQYMFYYIRNKGET